MSLELVKGLTHQHTDLNPNRMSLGIHGKSVHYLLTEMNCNRNILNIDGESPFKMCIDLEMISSTLNCFAPEGAITNSTQIHHKQEGPRGR